MKAGVRALGIAESFRGEQSTLAGAVVRASRVADGFAFADCTVGGLDATDAVVTLYEQLGREDVRYLLVGAIAPAWYNVVDLRRVAAETDRPVICVTFEESDGLVEAINREFDDEAADARLAIYRDQPARERVLVGDHEIYYRAVGLSGGEARDVLRSFTPEGGRPEPIRVARLAARAADGWRREG